MPVKEQSLNLGMKKKLYAHRTYLVGISAFLALAVPLTALAVSSTGTERINVGHYWSIVWHSDQFSGNHTRTFTEQQLTLDLNEKAGGFDTAVIRSLPPVHVDEMESTFCVSFDYAINLSAGSSNQYAEWYVGPKISVTGRPYWSPDDWYENYIVENSNLSPDTWHQKMLRDSNGTYLGSTTQNGSEYKHYVRKQETWYQYWAIRQNLRSSGTTSIAPIYQYWRSKGLPNGYFVAVRLNLETYGLVSGSFAIRNYNIAPNFETPCSSAPSVELAPPEPLPPCPTPAADNYKCYRTRQIGDPFERRDVTLEDQFVRTIATAKNPARLCNPVDKNGEGITDPTAHLMCYDMKEPRFEGEDVIVENQFGELALTVTRPDSLCVPAEKDGVPSDLIINHFKCYKVRKMRGAPGFTPPADVTLEDQFETKLTGLVRPRFLCTPVEKNGEQVVTPETHIMCYRIKDAPGQPRFERRGVSIVDQFAEQDLKGVRGDCRAATYLCVPSTKRLASPSDAFLEMTSGAID